MHQTPNKVVDRRDHIWIEREENFKCVLCGGITELAPVFPTPIDFMPITYEELSEEERDMGREKKKE